MTLTVHHQDCIDGLKELVDNSVDIIGYEVNEVYVELARSRLA